MFEHDLLALHLMRLQQHQQAYAGALDHVRRCLHRPDARADVLQRLAEIESCSAQLAILVERLKQTTDR